MIAFHYTLNFIFDICMLNVAYRKVKVLFPYDKLTKTEHENMSCGDA